MGARLGPGLAGRDRQNLPLPVGGMAPVRVRRRPRRRALRGTVDALVTTAALSCAAAGVLLLVEPAEQAASLVDGRVEVGSMVLTPVPAVPATAPGTVLYGGAASYALVADPDGSLRATASWLSAGRLSVGMCALRRERLRLLDHCTFTTPSATLTSVDVLDPATASSWQRTYSDGLRVGIAVPTGGAAIPVPFPIGR